MYDRRQIERLLEEAGDPGNPGPDELRDIVRATFVIAVVGISRDPAKAARRVPSYLAAKGADIIPVNPNATRILGRRARASLAEVDEPVDVVQIFRPSAEAAALIREAAARPEEPVIWLQEGIRNDDAAREAREAGRTVVQGVCMYKVHRALGDVFRRARGRGAPGRKPTEP